VGPDVSDEHTASVGFEVLTAVSISVPPSGTWRRVCCMPLKKLLLIHSIVSSCWLPVNGVNGNDGVRAVPVARLSAVCRHVLGDTSIRTGNPLPNKMRIVPIHVPCNFCYFVQWPTNAQLNDKLLYRCYMFRHYSVILRELVVSTLPSYTSMSNAAVGNTI